MNRRTRIITRTDSSSFLKRELIVLQYRVKIFFGYKWVDATTLPWELRDSTEESTLFKMQQNRLFECFLEKRKARRLTQFKTYGKSL